MNISRMPRIETKQFFLFQNQSFLTKRQYQLSIHVPQASSNILSKKARPQSTMSKPHKKYSSPTKLTIVHRIPQLFTFPEPAYPSKFKQEELLTRRSHRNLKIYYHRNTFTRNLIKGNFQMQIQQKRSSKNQIRN